MTVRKCQVVALTVNPLLVNGTFGIGKGGKATVDQVSVRIAIHAAASCVPRLVDTSFTSVIANQKWVGRDATNLTRIFVA